MPAIVVTKSASMPSSCKGHYRKVYVVDISPDAPTGYIPPQVRQGGKHIISIVRDLGPHNVGKTNRCAFARAVKEAEQIANDYNTTK